MAFSTDQPPSAAGKLAMELLEEEFSADDIQSKRRASERLDLVAKILGPEKSRSVLIPWLVDNIPKQEDQILYLFASKCSAILTAIGGVEHYQAIFPVLELLLAVEDSFVRESALGCMRCILKQQIDDGTKLAAAKLAFSLSTASWFASRMSACSLVGPLVLAGIDKECSEKLKEMFMTLCKDETPMVRGIVSSQASHIASVMNEEEIENLFSVFYQCATDPQESVSVAWISSIGDICQSLSDNSGLIGKHILKKLDSFASNVNWRVRCTIARQFDKIVRAISEETIKEVLLPIYVEFLQDPEGEVRYESVVHLTLMCQKVGPELFINEIYPLIQTLVKEEGHYGARLNIAQSLVEESMWVALGKNNVKKYIFPLWKFFLNESLSVFVPEICMAFLNALGQVSRFVGDDGIEPYWLPLLEELFQVSKRHNGGINDAQIDDDVNQASSPDEMDHPQWRVRISVLHAATALRVSSGQSAREMVMKLWTSSLDDEVYEVRLAAAEAVKDLLESADDDWKEYFLQKAVPHLQKYFEKAQQKHKFRVIFVYAFVNLFQADSKATEPLCELFTKCFHDKVVNVRIMAASAMKKGGEELMKRFQSDLMGLRNDADEDVKSFTEAALSSQGET